MIYIRSFVILSVFVLFIGLSLSAGHLASAQQNPPQKTAVPTPTPPIDEEDEVIKVDTEVVNVLFTAQDKNRRLLLDLKPEDVRIFEDGQPQTISAFSKQVDLPLSLAILIDTSASQERTLPEERRPQYHMSKWRSGRQMTRFPSFLSPAKRLLNRV